MYGQCDLGTTVPRLPKLHSALLHPFRIRRRLQPVSHYHIPLRPDRFRIESTRTAHRIQPNQLTSSRRSLTQPLPRVHRNILSRVRQCLRHPRAMLQARSCMRRAQSLLCHWPTVVSNNCSPIPRAKALCPSMWSLIKVSHPWLFFDRTL
jgi:hypothetical protein